MMRKTSVILLSAATGAALTLFVTQPRAMLMGSSARAATSDTYRQLNLFGDVFERVRSDYVEKPDDSKLVECAISGMLAGLDPHSSYMDAKSFRDMQVQTRGEFGGLGIEVTMEDGLIKVVSPIDDTPASKAGIMANDIITKLDDEAVQGLTLNQAVEKMRGSGQHQDPAEDHPQGPGQSDRRHAGARQHPRPLGARARRRGRHRLHPRHHIQRADHRRPEARDRQSHQPARRQAEGLHHRSAQQSRRVAGGSGDRVRRLPRARRDRFHPRPQCRGDPAPCRPCGRPDQGQAGDRADQRRLGFGVRNRRRRAAGPQACDAGRHPLVRQGLGADHHPARQRQRRAAPDHRALLTRRRASRSRPRASFPISRCCRTCRTS